MLGLFTLAGHPWLYFFLWLLPDLTVWRVINRLRAIAEHGGMQASPDRRETTHSVRQHLAGPAHDRAVQHGLAPRPSRRLRHPDPQAPALHAELVRAGYVQPGLEYRSYPALWQRARLRLTRPR